MVKDNAKTAEETGQLTFSHWGDADNPNPLHRNKAVYLFNTGEVWTGNEPQFNKEIHQIGKPITAIKSKLMAELDFNVPSDEVSKLGVEYDPYMNVTSRTDGLAYLISWKTTLVRMSLKQIKTILLPSMRTFINKQ